MADGDDKAKQAAERAVQCPLLEADIKGAKSAIINVTGGASMSAYDASEAVDYIRTAAGNDIDIIFGVAINDKIGDSVIVSVIATGFELPENEMIPNDGPAENKNPISADAAVKTGVVAESSDDEVSFGSEEEDDNVIPGFFRRS
jgi:cell division protein FtsZ